MKIKIFIIIILFFNLIHAQNKPVMGIVMNELEEKLVNVNIISLPSGTGTQTDSKGQFSFSIPIKDRSIKFEHVGYQNSEKNVILFRNSSLIIMKEKVLVMDSLVVEVDKITQFDKNLGKNDIAYINADQLNLRGSVDIGDALYFEQSIVLSESINGEKTASIRGSSSNELAFFYDGVRINRFGDPMIDLTMISTSGLSGLELLKGAHEDAISSSGSINLIPKISYKSGLSLKQQFGTYNYGGYDGAGSIGFRYGTVNTGLSEVQSTQFYSDTSKSELRTYISRNFVNIGLKNKNNSELKLLGFSNRKKFQNIKSGDSLSTKLESFIAKISQSDQKLGFVSIYLMYQENNSFDNLNFLKRIRYSDNREFGFEFQKSLKNASFRFSTQTSISDLAWKIDSNNVYIERQNSVFTGSLELTRPEKEDKIQLKDLKLVFSNERITDHPDTAKGIYLPYHYWNNNNSQFTISFLNKTKTKRLLYYLNFTNVYRIPSLYDFINNNTISTAFAQNDLLPEQKSTYEVGYRINRISKIGESSYRINIALFNYKYLNKIKNILILNSAVQYPVNYGNANLLGFDANINLIPNVNWIDFKWILSNYYFSDPLSFPLQPEKMVRTIISLKNRWFNIDFINRSESNKNISWLNESGTIETNNIKSNISYDLIFYKKIDYKFLKTSFSLSGKNLQNNSDVLNGISINDRRYNLSFNVSI